MGFDHVREQRWAARVHADCMMRVPVAGGVLGSPRSSDGTQPRAASSIRGVSS